MAEPNASVCPAIYMASGDTCLRAFCVDDLAAYRRWWDNFEVTRYMESGWRPSTDAIAAAFLDTAVHSDRAIVFAVVAPGGRLIGCCGLYEIFWPGRRAELRMMLGEPDEFGKGHGTRATRMLIEYAFVRANLEVVHLGVNADNVAAIRTYEKAGFVAEGRRRRFVYAAGSYHDAVVMSILRDDFFTLRHAV